jgi:hypothetical protein
MNIYHDEVELLVESVFVSLLPTLVTRMGVLFIVFELFKLAPFKAGVIVSLALVIVVQSVELIGEHLEFILWRHSSFFQIKQKKVKSIRV